jgi:hypothetical protein
MLRILSKLFPFHLMMPSELFRLLLQPRQMQDDYEDQLDKQKSAKPTYQKICSPAAKTI